MSVTITYGVNFLLQKQTRGEMNVTFIRALATAVTESCIEGTIFLMCYSYWVKLEIDVS